MDYDSLSKMEVYEIFVCFMQKSIAMHFPIEILASYTNTQTEVINLKFFLAVLEIVKNQFSKNAFN